MDSSDPDSLIAEEAAAVETATRLETPENKIHEVLLDLGYMAPAWDNFQLHYSFPTINPSESAILTTELTPIQQFLVKLWPRIENFYTEDEDLTVMLHAETVLKNGNLTRVFKFCYSPTFGANKEECLWEFVLEKQILPGSKWNNNNSNFIGNLRQKWAHISPGKKIQELTELKTFTRSFDSQAHCTKFKLNRSSTKVLDNLQKEFLNHLRKYVVEGFSNNISGVGLLEQESIAGESAASSQVYFRGKEIQFEENGNQIIWSMAQRKIPANSTVGNKTWFVNAPRKREAAETSKPEDQMRLKNSNSNPFEIDDVLGGEAPNGSEQQEYVRQVVERSIEDFISGVWSNVRNFFVTEALSTVTRRNSSPAKIFEIHFDSLDERNRWKCLLEISHISPNNPENTGPELRSYKSFERRGTTSSNSQDGNTYFNGLYKRWFLNELQMALVHCYAHIDLNALTLNHVTFDPQLYQVGKDLQFADGGHEIVWSFSVQKIPQYSTDDVPKDALAYKLANVSQHRDVEGSDVLRIDSQESIKVGSEFRHRRTAPGTSAPPAGRASKSRSSIKNMVVKTFRPVMERLGRKSVVTTPMSGRLTCEDSVSKSTLNASSYMADGESESMWSRSSTNQF